MFTVPCWSASPTRQALTDLAASHVTTQVALSANADGSNPGSLVTCAFSKTNHRFQCSLKAPPKVALYPTPYYLYPTPYYLRVTELIGGNYVKAPTVTSSKTANPEIVYFK